MNKSTCLLFPFIFFGSFLFGQCPIDAYPTPICENSIIFCNMLDGFVSTLSEDPNRTGPNPLCGGGSIPNNTEWISFVPEGTILTFSIAISNCTFGNGLQAGILSDCSDLIGSEIVCSGACPGPNPIVLSYGNYNPGDRYYLWIDGCSGAVCDYEIVILQGELGMAINISGDDQFCSEDLPAVFSVPIPDENCGTWYTEPPINFDTSGSDSILINDWQGESSVNVCIDLTDYCNAGVFCKEVSIGQTDVVIMEQVSYCPETPGHLYTDGNYYSEGIYFVTPADGSCDTINRIEVTQLDGELIEIDTMVCYGDTFTFENFIFTTELEDSITVLSGNAPDGCQRRLQLNLGLFGAMLELEEFPDSCGVGKGGIRVRIIGTDFPYGINWNDPAGQTSSLAGNLEAGYYEVTVTGTSGCSNVIGTNLEGVDPLESETMIMDVDCFGDTTGSIQVTVVNGNPGYTYQWGSNTGNQTTSQVNSLGAGEYFVTVTDTKGCMIIDTISINEPSVLESETSAIFLNCFGDSTGIAEVTGLNGTPGYTYQWDANAGNQTTSQANNLSAGIYFVTITDALGCTLIDSAQINEPPTVEITIETISATTGQSNGSASVSAIIGGTPPYQYTWLLMPPVSGVSEVFDLAAGTYEVMVFDANGCEYLQTFTIDVETALYQPWQQNEFTLFPNPNGGSFYLDLGSYSRANIHLELVNPLGRQVPIDVHQKSEETFEVSVLEKSAGWFLLMIFDGDTKQMIEGKQLVLVGEF